jgi:surfactin synthase thioesterase subunit
MAATLQWRGADFIDLPAAIAETLPDGRRGGEVSSPWFARYRPLAQPALRLVCFPYAGVGAAAYRPWIERLPRGVELWAVELPGRARRIAEPALSDVDTMTERLAAAVRAEIEGPFVFFGHSMGALLAFEVCRRLLRAGARLPRHLVVSGRRGPQLPLRREPIGGLPDDEFVRVMIERYDGIPEAVQRERELLALVLPTLRADVRALEDYRYEPGPPLPLPITALAGRHDVNVPLNDVETWREQTTATFALHAFDGGHFFVNTQMEAVLGLLNRDVLAGAP